MSPESFYKRQYALVADCQIDILSAVNSGRTDTDHFPLHIQYRAARAAVRSRRRKLDHIHAVDLAESRNNAVGYGIKKSQRASDGHHFLSPG